MFRPKKTPSKWAAFFRFGLLSALQRGDTRFDWGMARKQCHHARFIRNARGSH
jgi:hypothetical protein